MKKKYEDLTFTDDFMFCKVLANNEELCKELLELLIGIKIRGIATVNKQKSIDITADSKSVRLDVYVEDTEESVYDIEMQTSEDTDLPKRTRYYQGMLDLNQIEKGAKYKDLKKSFIIFICMKDPFHKNLPVYTFENTCKEAVGMSLGDETTKVFINVTGDTTGMSDEMKEFYVYLISGETKRDSFTERIDDEVRKARKHAEWRGEYMTLQMRYDEIADRAWREGETQGLAKGRESKLSEVVFEMLNDNLPVETIAKYCKEPEEVIRNIMKKLENH